MSTFSKWRKAELFDLMNKLKITDVSHSARKSDMITLVEHYLDNLEAPLDYIHDFPELQSFYEDRAQLKIESDVDEDLDTGLNSTTEEFEDELQEQLEKQLKEQLHEEEQQLNEEPEEEEQYEEEQYEDDDKQHYNKLDFSKINNISDFKFELEKKWDDIVDRTVVLNENVKDYLSSISSVETIFTIVELVLLVHHLCDSYRPVDSYISPENIVGGNMHRFHMIKRQTVHFLNEIGLPVATWFLLLRLLPCLISYYINFIRYDLLLQMDPMVYHLSKFIIEFVIMNKYSKGNSIEGFLNSFTFSPLAHLHVDPCNDLKAFYEATGYLPLVFSSVCVILTLYIL